MTGTDLDGGESYQWLGQEVPLDEILQVTSSDDDRWPLEGKGFHKLKLGLEEKSLIE
ncbi:MAG: hypothetical protein AAGA85_10470 [Bacteroidota bacterium]